MSEPGIVVGSFNARVGLPAAIAILRAGGSALDAATAAVREVEDDPSDRGSRRAQGLSPPH